MIGVSGLLQRRRGTLLVVLFVGMVLILEVIKDGALPHETKKLLTLVVTFGSMAVLLRLLPRAPLSESERILPVGEKVSGTLGWAKAITIFLLAIVFLLGVHEEWPNLVIAVLSLLAATAQNFVFTGAGQIQEEVSGLLLSCVRQIANSNLWIIVASMAPGCLIILGTAIFAADPLRPTDYLSPILLTLTWAFALIQHRRAEVAYATQPR